MKSSIVHRKIFVLGMALLLCLGCLCLGLGQVKAQGPTEVSTWEELKTAVTNRVPNIKLIDNLEADGMATIGYEVSIDGSGHVIKREMGTLDCIFNFTPEADVEMYDIDIDGATLVGRPATGSLIQNGGTLKIIGNATKKSTLKNNNLYLDESADKGGAILNNGTLILDSVEITNNQSSSGGAIHNDRGSVNIANSIISNHGDETGTTGGAIVNINKGQLEISNSTISNNMNDPVGGAILNDGENSTATIKDSLFENNNADIDGGAICNDGGIVTIENCKYTGNSAYQKGGAIANYNKDNVSESKMVIRDSEFIENRVLGEKHSNTGEATTVYNGENANIFLSGLTAKNNINDTVSDTGAIVNAGTMTIDGGEFSGNTNKDGDMDVLIKDTAVTNLSGDVTVGKAGSEDWKVAAFNGDNSAPLGENASIGIVGSVSFNDTPVFKSSGAFDGACFKNETGQVGTFMALASVPSGDVPTDKYSVYLTEFNAIPFLLSNKSLNLGDVQAITFNIDANPAFGENSAVLQLNLVNPENGETVTVSGQSVNYLDGKTLTLSQDLMKELIANYPLVFESSTFDALEATAKIQLDSTKDPALVASVSGDLLYYSFEFITSFPEITNRTAEVSALTNVPISYTNTELANITLSIGDKVLPGATYRLEDDGNGQIQVVLLPTAYADLAKGHYSVTMHIQTTDGAVDGTLTTDLVIAAAPTPTPVTGDSSNIGMLSALLILSLGAIVLLGSKQKAN